MITDLNLNQLKVFHFVAKYGGIKIPANKLMVTQPAISMQIKALQEHYELPLFTKRNNKLELTDVGIRLYRITENIFDLVEQADKLLMSAKGFPIDTLNLGINNTFFYALFIPLLSSYQSAFPNIQILIKEGTSAEMVQSVLTNHNELAVAGRVRYSEKIEFIPLIERPLFLIVPPGHRLCEKKWVSIDELKTERIIMKETGSGTRMLLEKACEKRRIFPRIIIETGNDECVGSLVKDGRGISIVLREVFSEDLGKGNLIAIPFHDEEEMIMKVDIVFKKGKRLSSAAKSFLYFVRKKTKGIKFSTDLL